MISYHANIAKFRIGVVVGTYGFFLSKHEIENIGHVIGFELNPLEEVIINVLWANGIKSPVHPSNLVIIE